jgi:hypothetical protein
MVMQALPPQARPGFLNNAITTAEAAVLACYEAGGKTRTISEAEIDVMANWLSRIVTLFSVSDDRAAAQPLKPAELRGGSFSNGGRFLRFEDGRPPIGDLMITYTAFKSALEIINAKA